MTGYAVLCFLGAGYDHKTPNKWRKVVGAGIDYLVASQNEGSFGPGQRLMYTQGIATMALAEAYGMTNDPNLKEPAQKAVDFLVAGQQKGDGPYGGGGWDYSATQTGRNDMSVTGWCIMALKSAKMSELGIADGMDRAKGLFDRAWKAANDEAGLNPTDPYSDISVFPYAYFEGDGAKMKFEQKVAGKVSRISPQGLGNNSSRTPIGLCMGVFLGHGQGDIMMESLANHAMKIHLPSYTSFDGMNQYWMYYNTLAIFQAGGVRWKEWNDTVRDVLVGAQKQTDDCFDGSWDYMLPGNNYHGHEVGRLLSTAYCCLSLEVYYRYKPQKIAIRANLTDRQPVSVGMTGLGVSVLLRTK